MLRMNSSFPSPTIENAPEADIEPPVFVKFPSAEPPSALQRIINDWGLLEHGEGGYFKETDRSPFLMDVTEEVKVSKDGKVDENENVSSEGKVSSSLKRNYSTLIYYLLTPSSPVGKLHKNKNRIIHILQRGKGQYVLIYPDGLVKSFKVGFDYGNGELSQWVVPGGVYKASFLLPNEEFSNGLLISEVVVPGFDYSDHSFMSGEEELVKLVGKEKAEHLHFLL